MSPFSWTCSQTCSSLERRSSLPRKLGPPRQAENNTLASRRTTGAPLTDPVWPSISEGHVTLVTSTDCEREARANLERKHPEAVAALDGLLDRVSALDHDLSPHREWAAALVHPGDVHVLAGARAAGAAALVTGDITHFGRLIKGEDLDLRVHTVRAFLEAGPAGL